MCTNKPRELDTRHVYYVYFHVTTDTGRIFYVGKGRGGRCRTRRGRNKFWNRIANKHGYTVIMWQINITEEEAFNEEKKQIERLRSDGFVLTNLTDGGEGTCMHSQILANQEQIRQFRLQNGRFPSHSKGAYERHLRKCLQHYCSARSDTYDAAFHEVMKALGYGQENIDIRISQQKDAILRFWAANNRAPSGGVKEERQMYLQMTRYCNPSHRSYDQVFRKTMEELGYGHGQKPDHINRRVLDKQECVRQFCITNNRVPSKANKDEKKLHSWMQMYCLPASGSYKKSFREEMEKFGYGQSSRKNLNNNNKTKAVELKMVYKNGTRP